MAASETDSMVEAAIGHWADETEALLRSCARLTEYFGTEEEEASWRRAVALPLAHLCSLRDPATRRNDAAPWNPADFVASEEVARILSPLLRVICEPVPELVGGARALLSEAAAKAVIVPFGEFSGTFARYVCGPLWARHPHLAPEAWPA